MGMLRPSRRRPSISSGRLLRVRRDWIWPHPEEPTKWASRRTQVAHAVPLNPLYRPPRQLTSRAATAPPLPGRREFLYILRPMALLRSVATVGGYTMVSRILGFVREVLTAAYLGAGPVADAFFVPLRLPNLFPSLFAEAPFSAPSRPLFPGKVPPRGAPRLHPSL